MSRPIQKRARWVKTAATINTDEAHDLAGTPIGIQVALYAGGYFLTLKEYDDAGELFAVTEISKHRSLTDAKRCAVEYAQAYGWLAGYQGNAHA